MFFIRRGPLGRNAQRHLADRCRRGRKARVRFYGDFVNGGAPERQERPGVHAPPINSIYQ